jgi:hypothetical protein
MEERAQELAARLSEAYGVAARALEVEGQWYVVYSGGDGVIVPTMIAGILIRREPWPHQ